MRKFGLDLKSLSAICHPASSTLVGGLGESGQTGVRANHRALAAHDVSPLRGTLRRTPQSQKPSLVSIGIFAFAQLPYRESLRDIEACLRAQQHKLYHMGISEGPSLSICESLRVKSGY